MNQCEATCRRQDELSFIFIFYIRTLIFFSCKISQCKKNTWNSWARLGHMMWRSVRKQHPCQLSAEWRAWVAEAPCAKALERGLKELCSTRGKRHCSTLWRWREKLTDLLPPPKANTWGMLSCVCGRSIYCVYLLYLHRNFKKKPVCSGQKHRDS